MKRLAIIGSGDLGEQIAYHAKDSFDVVGFFDDYETKPGFKHNLPILGGTSNITSAFKNCLFDEIIIGIGYKHMNLRRSLFTDLSDKIPFANIIHPTVHVESNVKLGVGNFILPGVILDKGVEIKNNTLINTGSVIAHDSTIFDHCFIAPSTAVAGFVKIKECCIIGINTTIIDNITISPNIQTGGGTVVIDNLIKEGLYVGNPARHIK